MDRILDRLFVGDSRDLTGEIPLRLLGFSGVLDLRGGYDGRGYGSESSNHFNHVDVFRLSNRDGDPWTSEDVEKAFTFLDEHIRKGRVLVACVAGMSRSASIAIGYLVRVGYDVPSAFSLVRGARPKILPHERMLQAVLQGIGMNEIRDRNDDSVPVTLMKKG